MQVFVADIVIIFVVLVFIRSGAKQRRTETLPRQSVFHFCRGVPQGSANTARRPSEDRDSKSADVIRLAWKGEEGEEILFSSVSLCARCSRTGGLNRGFDGSWRSWSFVKTSKLRPALAIGFELADFLGGRRPRYQTLPVDCAAPLFSSIPRRGF